MEFWQIWLLLFRKIIIKPKGLCVVIKAWYSPLKDFFSFLMVSWLIKISKKVFKTMRVKLKLFYWNLEIFCTRKIEVFGEIFSYLNSHNTWCFFVWCLVFVLQLFCNHIYGVNVFPLPPKLLLCYFKVE